MLESSTPHDQLRAAIAGWATIPDELWPPFAAIFTPRDYREKDHVVDVDEPFDRLFFVNRGLLRIYYLSADGREFNKSFITENMFAGSFSAFRGQSRAVCGVQALEETQLLAAKYRDFAAFYDRHPVFDRLGRLVLEWLLVRKEQREQSFLLGSAKDRFLDFAAHAPELVGRVPQYHLASYLGIAEVSLSRLKRGLS